MGGEPKDRGRKMSDAAGLCNREWLSSLLKKTRLSPFGIFMLFVVINLLTTIPVAIIFGAWDPTKFSPGMRAEPSAILNDDLAIPIIFAYFLWIQGAFNKVVNKFIAGGILTKSERVLAILDGCRKQLQSKWLPILASLAGVIFTTWFLLLFTQSESEIHTGWVYANPAIPWIRAPMMFITVYALVLFLTDLGIMIKTFNTLFQDETIRVEPLHPDGAGGLSPIGAFTSSLGYMIFMIGVAYSFRIVGQNIVDFAGTDDIMTWLGLVIYLVVSPLFFFLPLRAVRAAMIRSRDGLLMELSAEFDVIFNELHKLRSKNAEMIEPYLKRYRQINETRKIIEKFPVWPFNIGNLRNFFGLVVIPILPALISIVIDLFK
jgi:hypothetical protein